MIQFEWVIFLFSSQVHTSVLKITDDPLLLCRDFVKNLVEAVVNETSHFLNNSFLCLNLTWLLWNLLFFLLVSQFQRIVLLDHVHLFLFKDTHDSFWLYFKELKLCLSGCLFERPDFNLVSFLHGLDLLSEVIKALHCLALHIGSLFRLILCLLVASLNGTLAVVMLDLSDLELLPVVFVRVDGA